MIKIHTNNHLLQITHELILPNPRFGHMPHQPSRLDSATLREVLHFESSPMTRLVFPCIQHNYGTLRAHLDLELGISVHEGEGRVVELAMVGEGAGALVYVGEREGLRLK